jgi:hypothetical protein
MALLNYVFFARDSSSTPAHKPLTGLTPSWVFLKKLSDGTAISPPAVTEIGSGQYKLSYDPESTGEASGQLDLGATIQDYGDRYIDLVFYLSDSRTIFNLDTPVSRPVTVASVSSGAISAASFATGALPSPLDPNALAQTTTNLIWKASSRTLTSLFPASDFVWFDDAFPPGAQANVGPGGPWSWVSSNPTPDSGTLALQSDISTGQHQIFFVGATQTMAVLPGDLLFAYVYLDPANPPDEIMLQWYTGASWEHRAYWGSNEILWGVDGTPSRISVGPLPVAGIWARLEVLASMVGLEGLVVNGLAFSLKGGRATWDRTGRAPANA